MEFLETSLNRLIKIVDDQRWVGNILKTKSIKNLVNAYKDQCMNKMEEKHMSYLTFTKKCSSFIFTKI